MVKNTTEHYKKLDEDEVDTCLTRTWETQCIYANIDAEPIVPPLNLSLLIKKQY